MCSAQPEILKLIDDLITLAQCTQEQLEDLMSTEEMFVGYQRKGRLLLKQFLEAERCFFPILFNIPKQRFEHRLVDFRGEEWDEITGDAPPNVELIYWDAGSGESERSRRFSDNVRLYVWGRETIERNISMSWLTFDPIKALKNCIRGLSQLRRRVPEVCDLVLAKSVAKELSSVATGRTAPGSEERVFKREGDYWQIDYEGKSVQLKNSKGLQYISWLLRFSGEYLDALTIIDLVEERQLPNASRFLSGLA